MTGNLLHLASMRLALISQALLDLKRAETGDASPIARTAGSDAREKTEPAATIPVAIVQYYDKHVAAAIDGPVNANAFHVFMSERNGTIYRHKGVLQNESIDPFVEDAYALILGRRTDFEGREIYSQSLRTRTLTRFDALVHMACSQEARRTSRRILIVPQTSAWLKTIDRDVSTCALSIGGGDP